MVQTRRCYGGFTKLQMVLREKGRHVGSHRSSKVVKQTVSLDLVPGIVSPTGAQKLTVESVTTASLTHEEQTSTPPQITWTSSIMSLTKPSTSGPSRAPVLL